MSSLLLVLIVVLVLAGLIFGIVALLSGEDPGLGPVEPDGRALPLPANRSLAEADLKAVRFDTAIRGYRMNQVDRALRRTAYDIGYKDEMIAVLEAEVIALREGRTEDADLLRKAREAASDTTPAGGTSSPVTSDESPAPMTAPAAVEEPDNGPVDHADVNQTDADQAEADAAEAGEALRNEAPTDEAPTDDEAPTATAEPTNKDAVTSEAEPTDDQHPVSSSAEPERSARA